jgi:hypothetical protein
MNCDREALKYNTAERQGQTARLIRGLPAVAPSRSMLLICFPAAVESRILQAAAGI